MLVLGAQSPESTLSQQKFPTNGQGFPQTDVIIIGVATPRLLD
ncbi:hypothetical protein [Neosynechococcus sphagnicola]|nr:hypothetical protein [Neosynechococcus sphagnicola]